MESGDNSSYNDLFDNYTKQLYAVQFWIFLLLIIPSIIFTFLSLYYLLSVRTLRQALNNHVIILLLGLNLFCEFTDISFFIHYFRSFESFTASPTFRLLWGYIDWTFFLLLFMLYAWVTIERHFLIFHNQIFATRNKRIFLHYLPPFIISTYCCLYYAVVFFVAPCANNFENLNQPVFSPCAFENNTLAMYDIIAHSILPTLTIVISSFVLLFRVLWQRFHLHGQIHWRRHRKLTIQVLSISFIYLILAFPYLLVVFLHICGMPSYIGAEFLSLAVYGVYYTMLLFPIICAGSLSELRKQIKKVLGCQRQRRVVAPSNFALVQTANNRIIIQ